MPEAQRGASGESPACLARPLRGRSGRRDGAWRMRPLRGQEADRGTGHGGDKPSDGRRVGDESKSRDLAWLPLPPNLGPPSACPGRGLSWGTSQSPACTERPQTQGKADKGRGRSGLRSGRGEASEARWWPR